MLQESNCFQKIYIACGKTDLRKGIDGLAELVKHQFQLEPYQKNVLFLFCGTRSDRIKGLVWEGEKVPYSSVLGEYQESAYEGIEQGRYPDTMSEVIKNYFGGLADE